MLLLNHSCDVSRNEAVGTNGRHEMQTVHSGMSCLFLPMSSTAAIQNGYSVGKAYEVYFDDGADIKTGDKLAYDGNTYIVNSVSRYANVPPVSYVSAMCSQEIA